MRSGKAACLPIPARRGLCDYSPAPAESATIGGMRISLRMMLAAVAIAAVLTHQYATTEPYGNLSDWFGGNIGPGRYKIICGPVTWGFPSEIIVAADAITLSAVIGVWLVRRRRHP